MLPPATSENRALTSTSMIRPSFRRSASRTAPDPSRGCAPCERRTRDRRSPPPGRHPHPQQLLAGVARDGAERLVHLPNRPARRWNRIHRAGVQDGAHLALRCSSARSPRSWRSRRARLPGSPRVAPPRPQVGGGDLHVLQGAVAQADRRRRCRSWPRRTRRPGHDLAARASDSAVKLSSSGSASASSTVRPLSRWMEGSRS